MFATVALYIAFFGLWYLSYLCQSGAWIYIMKQKFLPFLLSAKINLIFKNYIKTIGKYFINKEIKIEYMWHSVSDSCAAVRHKHFSKSQVKQTCTSRRAWCSYSARDVRI